VIEAVGVTVAPFIKAEKPQLFPWLAARLIKKRRCISELGHRGAGCRIAKNNRGAIVEFPVMPIFIGSLG
jgi:hypothetical protein